MNRTERTGRHFIEIELAGGPTGNPRGIGALVEVDAAGRTQHRRIRCASSFLSSSPARAHFGLAASARARVRVTWPDGEVGPWMDADADSFVDIDRESGQAVPWTPPGP